MPISQLSQISNEIDQAVCENLQESIISFQAKLPLSLNQAMNQFIETHPNWDQYRLLQAALAGFLVQNGMHSREITRLYVGNMFASRSLLKGG